MSAVTVAPREGIPPRQQISLDEISAIEREFHTAYVDFLWPFTRAVLKVAEPRGVPFNGEDFPEVAPIFNGKQWARIFSVLAYLEYLPGKILGDAGILHGMEYVRAKKHNVDPEFKAGDTLERQTLHNLFQLLEIGVLESNKAPPGASQIDHRDVLELIGTRAVAELAALKLYGRCDRATQERIDQHYKAVIGNLGSAVRYTSSVIQSARTTQAQEHLCVNPFLALSPPRPPSPNAT